MDNGNDQNNYMICPNCKQYVAYGSSFCNYCGFRFQYQQMYYQQQSVDAKGKNGYVSFGLIFGFVSAFMVLISTFLPYAKISLLTYNESISIVIYDFGKLILFLTICFAITIAIKQGIPTTIIGALISMVSIIKMFDFEDCVSELVVEDVNVSGFVSKGAGCYMLLIFSILIFISGIILIVENVIKKRQ